MGETGTKTGEKKHLLGRLVDGVSGIFLPIVTVLSAAGVLKGVLAILTAAGVLSDQGGTYLILYAMGDAVFYFLPMFLAYTAAKRMGANPFSALAVAGVLLYPSLAEAFGAGTGLAFLGLPIKAVTYQAGVIPILLAVGLLRYLEKGLHRVLPAVLSGLVIPLVCIPVTAFATLFLFGPAGALMGEGLAWGYGQVYAFSPVLAGLLLGAIQQPLVIFGIHWSFNLIAMNNVMIYGHDTILALTGPAVFGQAGAALAVFVKSRDKAFKSVSGSAVLSGLLGITEPAIFGVNLPRKVPMIAACIGGGVGGALAGLSGAQAMSFAFPAVVTLPVFFGQGFGLFVGSCLIGFGVAFALTFFLRFRVDLSA